MTDSIGECRICRNTNLVPVVDLGNQYLTGVFPRTADPDGLTSGPLQLVKCHGGNDACGLVQLRHSFPAAEMYGDTYGYRSNLNTSMVEHLYSKVDQIQKTVRLEQGDVVLDIGSNDGTTLSAYTPGPRLIGIDPAARKFAAFYPPHVEAITDFFSQRAILQATNEKLVKVVTSFAMLYDVEDPIGFAKEVGSVLARDGIWVFEQSYMPLMVERLAYDTICHEHIEYYGLRQIHWILRDAGLRILDVEFNNINGGSFSVTAGHASSDFVANDSKVSKLLAQEIRHGFNDLAPFEVFADKVKQSRDELVAIVSDLRDNGKRICGLGASTKGNVLLQYAQFDQGSIESIGDVNPEKHGCVTPGSWIPIVSEDEVLLAEPDYLLVLPWHFRPFFMSSVRFAGRNLMFPLPAFEIVAR